MICDESGKIRTTGCFFDNNNDNEVKTLNIK